MIVRLFCPVCAKNLAQSELVQKQSPSATIGVPVPVSRISEDGKYNVRCDANHESTVILSNLKFELLFEMGLNAIVDGYPREAVSSFSSSLECFYEFYWRTAMNHSDVDGAEVDIAWRSLSRQSERQLGAFVASHLAMVKSGPELLGKKEIELRNRVIHKGYVPPDKETIIFGDEVMRVVTAALDGLREAAPDTMLSTYEEMSPARATTDGESEDSDEIRGITNVLTAIDVRHPPGVEDQRMGSAEDQLLRIVKERQAYGMELLSEDEFVKRFPDQQGKRESDHRG